VAFRLTPGEVEEAAQLLTALRRREIVLDDLPDHLIPQTTVDIQRIIDATHLLVRRPVLAWKVYCVYKPMQPVFYAPVYDVVEDGGFIPLELSGLRLIEPEIMFNVDADLERHGDKMSHAALSQRLTARVGFEVVGGRFRPRSVDETYALSKSQRSNYGVLSDHIANSCIVTGALVPGWRDVSFENVRVTLREGERVLVDTVGGHPFDDPFLPALVGINRILRTHDIEAGTTILTSSSTSFFPVRAGKKIHAEYEGIGAVSATFALE
jgi:2-keto-4-pentenoate hydratase